MPSTLSGDMTGDPSALAATLPNVDVIPTSTGEFAISVFGVGSDQNATVLNDMNVGASLPRDAFVMSVVSSTYDPGKGGFAGAQLSLRMRQGENLPARSVHSSLESSAFAPASSANPLSSNGFSQNVTNAAASGPLSFNRAFYATSVQLTKRTSAAPSLLGLSERSLTALGLSPASMAAVVHTLDSLRVPTVAAGFAGSSTLTDARFSMRLDLEPGLPARPNGVTSVLPATVDDYSVQFGASTKRRAILPGSLTSLPSTAISSSDDGAWIQLGASTYMKDILSELMVSGDISRSGTRPAVAVPTALVSFMSQQPFSPDPQTATIEAGGAGQATFAAQNWSVGVRDRLSWNSWDRRHSPSLTFEASREWYRQQRGESNGTFAYPSIAALAAADPYQFSRVLGAHADRSTARKAAIGLGDVFAPGGPPDILAIPRALPAIQYGLRFEYASLGQHPEYNRAVDSVFHRRTDLSLKAGAILPMVGFTWPILDAVYASNGAPAGRRATLSGGVRKYRGSVSDQFAIPFLNGAGLDSTLRELTCVGDAVPTPNWVGYLDHQAAIPDACAAGAAASPAYAQSVPSVRLLAPGFQPYESWRPELGLSLRLSELLVATANATLALNRHISASSDLNFDGLPKFYLASEGNRPVYVPAADIVAANGASTTVGSRRSPLFGRVYETRSDFHGETRSFGGSLRWSPIVFDTDAPRTVASIGYNHSASRQQSYGFSGTTGGDPRAVAWMTSTTPSHVVTLSLSRVQPRWADVALQARVQSGVAYTPVVDGDLNGDGLRNDRAFIFSRTTAPDSSVAGGMTRLVDASGAGRCLARQIDRIAEANSCRGPWSMPLFDIAVTPAATRLGLGNRATLRIVFSNAAAGLDQALHGANATHGWGQLALPDPVLLSIRGFDAASQRYRYTVNPFFGKAGGAHGALRRPFVFTIDGKLDVGRDRETLMLASLMRSQSGEPLSVEEIKGRLGSGSRGLTILVREAKRLQLTAEQTAGITQLSRRLSDGRSAIVDSLATFLWARHGDYGGSEVREMWHRAAVDSYSMYIGALREALSLLSPSQRSLMTTPVLRELLDLESVRPDQVAEMLRGPRASIP